MPYILEELRPKYRDILKSLPEIETKGDLEYCIYYLMLKFMQSRQERYSQLHDCVYAGHHAAHEFERDHLDKREDVAKEDNGPITL
jgi:hypothetical protein